MPLRRLGFHTAGNKVSLQSRPTQPINRALISGPAQPRISLIEQALSAGQVASQAPSGVSVGAAASAGLGYNPGSPVLGPKPLVSMTTDPNASGITTLASSMVNPGGGLNKITSTSTPLEAIRQGITAKESGGNYKAQSKTSTASGRYQYLDGTWGNYKGYKKASDAPPEIQDEKFNQDMGKYLTKYNGNLEAAAIAWFQGPGVADKFAKGDTSVLSKTDANGKTTASYSKEVADIARSYLNASGPSPIGNTVDPSKVDHTPTPYDGHQVQAWIIPALEWAKQNGWKGKVVSGIRSPELQAELYAKYKAGGNIAAKPGQSNHDARNKGAVDVSNPEELAAILKNYPGLAPKWGYAVMGKDKPHFSLNGR